MSRIEITALFLCLCAACSASGDDPSLSGRAARAAAATADDAEAATLASSEAALAASCDHPSADPPADSPAYRVQIYPTVDDNGQHVLPSPDQSWTLKYEYVVPPLPCSSTWNHNLGTFYIWGDVDFDAYGAYGGYPLSSYVYNQIVPQLMIGNALSGNDAAYAPSWTAWKTWVIQAQYFWQNQDGRFYAQAGDAVHVKPGEHVTTVIKYDAANGSIAVRISTPRVASAITIPRPFPNESPALFASWRDFFEQGVAQSTTLYGRPQMNVETYDADTDAVCGVLPWKVDRFAVPGTPVKARSFTVVPGPGLACPDGQYAKLRF